MAGEKAVEKPKQKPKQKPEKIGVIGTDTAYLQVAAEEVAKKTGKEPRQVTLQEAREELEDLSKIGKGA